ncbi:beta-lactamase family protein [Solitalea sp. MAHUQ-68]|uniref:Beta-lactamase family protein n=1 Tax=Solitalea agri TaxID=2953739 RepID=A0A9X2JGB0_9SPHI|nr:serine hydrolase [Solitalea agri]MCO4294251.1 beta-lactamase family protein [Solitalea agri]
MKRFFILLFLHLISASSYAQNLTSATPESLGISSKAILNFVEAAEKQRPNELHSFMLVRHGKVAAQGWWNPYNPESPHMLFSLSKSFTSTAIGMAQAEGLLSINDPVISFFPNETPKDPSKNLKEMRIRDLLKMSTGHKEDATGSMQKDTLSWVRGFLSQPVEFKPGTHFVYNSAGTFMLSAIIQKVSGKSLLEYLTPRLFEPLGIEHPTWEKSPEGVDIGGWGLKVRTQDIANFGQLYLQKGMWNGKQLISAAWVVEATSFQASNGSNPNSDWDQGYGYQFWRCRHNLYRGDGAFGQYCIVFPEQDAVLAITSGTKDMGAIMNLVWDHLLPALKESSLPEDKEAQNALQAKLCRLSLSVAKGEASSPISKSVSEKTYTMAPNRELITSIRFNLKSKTPSLTIFKGDKSSTLSLGYKTFAKGDNLPMESSYAWTAPDTLEIKTYAYETPFNYTYTIAFKKEKVFITQITNVGNGSDSPLKLEGEK